MGSEHKQTKGLCVGDERNLGAKYYYVCRCVNYCVGRGTEALVSLSPPTYDFCD
jgi:hypothetical protein